MNTRIHVLVRDGFVCQFCGGLLFVPQAMKLLDFRAGLNLWDPHGSREPLRSGWACVDHLQPEIAGGMDDRDNLAAICVVCNSRKGGTRKPCPAPQRCDGWDGLAAIFLGLAPSCPDRLSSEDNKHLAALGREGIRPNLAGCDEVIACLRHFAADPSSIHLDATLPGILCRARERDSA